MRHRFIVSALAVLTGAATLAMARAETWPAKPVRIVSPFAPGGGSDTVGRVIAEQLSRRFGEQFVVENRGGAGGLIGTAAVANASPDGYTYVVSSIGTHVIAPITAANPTYDPIRSFAHVAYLGGPPTVIVVHPSLGVKSLTELVALLRSRKEPLPYVSPGPGTIGNLIAEFWAEREGLKLSHVAYKGAGQAVNDLVAGHVRMGSITWTAARGQMRAGTLIPLAVSSARRMPGFDNLPTFKELGFPDLVVTTWFGIAAPAGVSAAIVQRMNTAINASLDEPTVHKRLSDLGFEVEKMSPTVLTAYVESEITKWTPLAKSLIAH
jgi:tripartite-type tricarboxylate transporter receptor subunit TctC